MSRTSSPIAVVESQATAPVSPSGDLAWRRGEAVPDALAAAVLGTAPSTWYAAVAAPQTKSAGNRRRPAVQGNEGSRRSHPPLDGSPHPAFANPHNASGPIRVLPRDGYAGAPMPLLRRRRRKGVATQVSRPFSTGHRKRRDPACQPAELVRRGGVALLATLVVAASRGRDRWPARRTAVGVRAAARTDALHERQPVVAEQRPQPREELGLRDGARRLRLRDAVPLRPARG